MLLEIIVWILAYSITLICLGAGAVLITWVFWNTLRRSLNKFAEMKSNVWLVRRWSAQERVIEKLQAEIEQLKAEKIKS